MRSNPASFINFSRILFHQLYDLILAEPESEEEEEQGGHTLSHRPKLSHHQLPSFLLPLSQLSISPAQTVSY